MRPLGLTALLAIAVGLAHGQGPAIFRVGDQHIPLTPRQQSVRRAVVDRVEAQIDGYVERYRALEGAGRAPLLVNSDLASRLFPEYVSDPASNAASVHEAAVAVAEEVWRRALLEPDPRGLNRVLLLAGGGAGGKSTALRRVPELRRLGRESQLVYDSTLAMFPISLDRVRRALAAGKTVTVVYVYAPIELAARRAVDRALHDERIVPAPAVAASHWYSQRSVLRLADRLSSERRVRFFFLDDSAARPALEPIEALRPRLYADDPRFPTEAALARYTDRLIGAEIERAVPARLRPEFRSRFELKTN